MRCAIVGAAVIVVLASPAAGQDPPVKNAAVHYWQAFALMPDKRALSDAEHARNDTPRADWPLDATTATYLDRYRDSFAYFHRGAALPHCHWCYEDDLGRDGITPLPQTGRAMDLRDAVLLRARLRFAKREIRRAAEDLVALVRFGRHVEPGSGLMGVIVSWNSERMAGESLAANLGAVVAEPGLLKTVRREWVAIRPARALRSAFDEERDRMVGMFRTHAEVDPDDLPADFRGPPIPAPGTLAYYLGRQSWDDAVRDYCASYHRLHDRWGTLAHLAPGDVDAAEKGMIDGWVEDTAGEDPIAAYTSLRLRYGVATLRKTECRTIAHRAMLRAALAAAADGEGVFDQHRDPFGDGPFRLTRIQDGYELESALGRAIEGRVLLRVRTTRPKGMD